MVGVTVTFKPLGKRGVRAGGLCECIVGQDPNSHQPHLIKCSSPAVWQFATHSALGGRTYGQACDGCRKRLEAGH